MDVRKILLLPIPCFIIIAAVGQNKWDLKRSVEYALANNISVKQADIQARIAALNLKQSRLSQFPSANFSADAGLSSGRFVNPTTNDFTTQQTFSSGLGLTSGVTVFNFFSIRSTIEGNRFDNEAARANIEKIKNDIALNVATAYLLVLVAVEQSNIAEVAVQQTLQNFDNTSKRVKAGDLPELNLAELEAQLARDSSALITANSAVQQNILQLKAILNLDAAEPFDVDVPPLEKIPVQTLSELQPESVYALALVNLPQQKANELRIKAAQKFVQAARGQMYPSLSLFGSLGSTYANAKIPIAFTPTGTFDPTGAIVKVNGVDYNVLTPAFTQVIGRIPLGDQLSDNFRQNFGMQINVPLFNSGLARTAWERSKLNVNSLELQKSQDLLTLKQDIYTAYNDAATAIQKYRASVKGVETAEKAYNFARRRYDLGLLSTLDLLTNQNNLNRARVELLQTQLDYVFRLKLLEFYKGQGLTLE